ncbi:hypothetical protein ACFFR3_40330 [Nonomuraea salmonea]|jgi:hypothetical protein|uniref:Acetone carboxylase subunit gamma n=1 Tax=Nonomuraea salmonea TaxID=46181 RepID=A0ABV5P003_9ACTN
MGDWFQTIVDVQATPQEAETLAADVRSWLISSGIVSAEPTHCVLGADVGHPPGPRAETAVDPSGWSVPWHDGLAITVGRTVFDAGQGDPMAVTCPHCSTTTHLADERFELKYEVWEPFREVVRGWDEGDDIVIACPACTQPVEPTSWRWTDDYFVLAYLGFTFWNWPPLRPQFVDDLARHLADHRTVLLEGKL